MQFAITINFQPKGGGEPVPCTLLFYFYSNLYLQICAGNRDDWENYDSYWATYYESDNNYEFEIFDDIEFEHLIVLKKGFYKATFDSQTLSIHHGPENSIQPYLRSASPVGDGKIQ